MSTTRSSIPKISPKATPVLVTLFVAAMSAPGFWNLFTGKGDAAYLRAQDNERKLEIAYELLRQRVEFIYEASKEAQSERKELRQLFLMHDTGNVVDAVSIEDVRDLISDLEREYKRDARDESAVEPAAPMVPMASPPVSAPKAARSAVKGKNSEAHAANPLPSNLEAF